MSSVVQRSIVNILVVDLQKSLTFYNTLFSIEILFQSDWYVQFRCNDDSFEFGLIDENHELIPGSFSKTSGGVYLTFVVEDVDEAYQTALEHKVTIIDKPTDTFYGQCRMLVKDPDGNLLDISSLIS